jgi:hypothetical protein
VRLRLIVVALCFALSGCASLESEVQPWMGRTKAELIDAWGPPLSTQSDGQGGIVLYYARSGGTRIWMYAHKNGKLYYWRTRERG